MISSSTDLPRDNLVDQVLSELTMESAVISGRLAAGSVAEQLHLGSVEVDTELPREWLAKWMIRP